MKKYFGEFGGQFVPEILITPLNELEEAFTACKNDANFNNELASLLKNYAGRPTPLTHAKQLSQQLGGAQIYLKREDLLHTGAHKINNTLGQALLAKCMGKKRLIAETGAGQSGVATATVAALLGFECSVYMGAKDMQRQALNVARMKMLGAQVIPVEYGSKTLKDATSQTLRDWATNVKDSYYVLGSTLGPHPYPTIVRYFQQVIGIEAQQQLQEQTGKQPDMCIACIGGGSNAIGLFYPFIDDKQVKLVGVEAGGLGIDSQQHAARMATGSLGVFQGTKSIVLHDEHGNINTTHSIAAGLDYPVIGPEHAHLATSGRASYTHVTDKEAFNAAMQLAKFEGIIPALESAHALAYAIKTAPKLAKDEIIIVNLSGRGDKDMQIYIEEMQHENS